MGLSYAKRLMGQKNMAGSIPVVFAIDQTAIPLTGTITANLGTIAGIATEVTLALLNAKFGTLGQKTMVGSAPVVIASDQAQIPTVQNRPSQGTGRTFKTAKLSNQTADALLYTVTATKTLYVTTLSIFVFNVSTTQVGVLELKDGTTAAGTLQVPALMSAAGVGAVTAASAVSHVLITMEEPLPFTSGLFFDITSGTLTYSAFMVGYEI